MSRRFGAGSTHVTAFVASPGATTNLLGSGSSPAEELRHAFAAAGVSLDVAVLCSREELGAAACVALETLAASDSTSSGSSSEASDAGEAAVSSSGSGSNAGGAVEPAASSGSESNTGHVRLVWLRPVATAAESWEQLEPALEQLEGGSSSGSAPAASAGAALAQRSALPRHISRAPRQFADPLQRPRTSLLAPRSGVQQPALCR